MKYKQCLIRFLLFLCIFNLVGFYIPSYIKEVHAAPSDQKIYDYAGLFTDEEIDKLEDICLEYGEEGKVDIVIITENGLGGKTRKQYLEDFYDTHGFGYDTQYGDTALILINMDPNDRGVEIQGYGMAEHYVHNDRIEHILDDLVPLLQDADYYEAANEFAKQVAYYMNEEKGVNPNPVYGEEGSGNYYGEASYDGPSNYYGEESFFVHPIFRIVISLIVGGVVVGIMAHHSSGRITTRSRTYLDEKTSRIVARHDQYLRTTTTRVRKPSNDSSGRSSGGGGVSSGGHSHSGGGRSF